MQDKRKLESDCNPSVCLCWNKNKPSELMRANWIFVTKEIYKSLCSNDCPNKQICWTVIDKLQALKTEEAIALLTNNVNE